MIMVKMKIRLFWMMIQSLRGLIESRKTTMVMVKKCRITGKRTIGLKSIQMIQLKKPMRETTLMLNRKSRSVLCTKKKSTFATTLIRKEPVESQSQDARITRYLSLVSSLQNQKNSLINVTHYSFYLRNRRLLIWRRRSKDSIIHSAPSANATWTDTCSWAPSSSKTHPNSKNETPTSPTLSKKLWIPRPLTTVSTFTSNAQSITNTSNMIRNMIVG